jgi:hypothetical protein
MDDISVQAMVDDASNCMLFRFTLFLTADQFRPTTIHTGGTMELESAIDFNSRIHPTIIDDRDSCASRSANAESFYLWLKTCTN